MNVAMRVRLAIEAAVLAWQVSGRKANGDGHDPSVVIRPDGGREPTRGAPHYIMAGVRGTLLRSEYDEGSPIYGDGPPALFVAVGDLVCRKVG